MKFNRRNFMVSTASGLAAPALSIGKGGALGANDRVVCAFVGVGGMGRGNMRDFMRMDDVTVAAVCDVWKHNRDEAVAKTEEQESGKAEAYDDFRRVLELKHVDVVVVATPDHWHALPTVGACEAGKDVYVEKPLSLTIYEGRKMVEAARNNQRVVQMGTQQRSGKHYQEAVRLIQEGGIGKISRVTCWNHTNESPLGIGNPSDSEPPEGLDWDRYLGPAPKVPFNPNRFIHTFRWFWDYSGGMLTDWGTHHLDIVQWAMNVQAPLSAFAGGSKFHIQDNRETPDTLEVLYEYPGFLVSFSNRFLNSSSRPGWDYGIEFFGTDGTLSLNRSGYRVVPETRIEDEEPMPRHLKAIERSQRTTEPWELEREPGIGRTQFRQGQRSDQHYSHVRNFLDCVKSREKPASDVETGHRSTSVAHLGNISLHTGRKIHWDADEEKIVEDAEANALLRREYRAPWKL